VFLPVAVPLARTARRWMVRGLAIVAAGGGAVMLFLSHSEGAWLGILVAPVLYVVFFRPAGTRQVRMRRLLIVGAILGVACLGGFLLATMPPEQLNEHSDGRYYLFRAALNMLRHSPLVGVGLGNFYQDLGGFYPDGISGRETHEQAHNMYLQLLTELGPLGLVTFALPFVTLLSRAARTPGMTPMTRALLIGVLAVLLHSFTDYTLWIAAISLLFWMYLGALAVMLDASSEHPGRTPTASGP
jgi:O-antigen ligase